jgi:hypothetical protein
MRAFLVFAVLGLVVGACGGGDDDSPCKAICACVIDALGDAARTQCYQECSEVSRAPDPVLSCKERLASHGVSACNHTCDAFGDDPAPAPTGSSAGGAASSSGRTAIRGPVQ